VALGALVNLRLSATQHGTVKLKGSSDGEAGVDDGDDGDDGVVER